MSYPSYLEAEDFKKFRIHFAGQKLNELERMRNGIWLTDLVARLERIPGVMPIEWSRGNYPYSQEKGQDLENWEGFLIRFVVTQEGAQAMRELYARAMGRAYETSISQLDYLHRPAVELSQSYVPNPESARNPLSYYGPYPCCQLRLSKDAAAVAGVALFMQALAEELNHPLVAFGNFFNAAPLARTLAD